MNRAGLGPPQSQLVELYRRVSSREFATNAVGAAGGILAQQLGSDT